MHKTVSIIGCSVSGLATGLELLKLDRSIDVTLYDKKNPVGSRTVCGGAISSFMLQELDLKIPRYAVASEIKAVRIHSPNGNFWELKSGNGPYGYVLYRDIFEMYLADEIRRKGGKFWLACEVTNFDDSPIIVGADGLTGISRKLLKLKRPKLEDIHIGIQRIAYLPHTPDRLDLYFGAKFAPRGYAWIFPNGVKNQVRIGLGIPLNETLNAKKLLNNFINYTGAQPLGPIKAKPIPTAKPPRKLVYNNVLLVGDAGLLCDPSTGGGIANAMLSGKYAAKAIHEGNLKKYDDYCTPLKRRNNFRYKIKELLCSLSDDDFNTLIQSIKDFHPKLTRISWAIIHALIELAIKNPKLVLKHKVLRKLLLKSY